MQHWPFFFISSVISLFSSPEPKTQAGFSDHNLSERCHCLRRCIVVVNFSHFHLLLQNQTWHKAFFGEGNSRLYKRRIPKPKIHWQSLKTFYSKTKNTLTIFENVLFPNQKYIDNLWKCSIPKPLGHFNFKQTWHKTSWVKGIQDFEKQRINYF